jgi:hypothetical protein
VKATLADWNKWKTEFQGLMTKLKKKQKKYYTKDIRASKKNTQELCDSIK